MFKLITLERAILANRIKSYLFLIATQLRTTIISKNLSTYRKKEEFQGVTEKSVKISESPVLEKSCKSNKYRTKFNLFILIYNSTKKFQRKITTNPHFLAVP